MIAYYNLQWLYVGMNECWIKLHVYKILNLHNFRRTWSICKKKYKIILIEYNNDKRLNEILDYDRREYHYN